jgi:outer membrane translocation and assembly module TamA
MAFTVEHRWLVKPMLQLVGFADAGQVAPSLGAFDLSALRTSVGAGVRVKIKNAAVVRLDFATGREGSRWVFGVGPSF